MAPFNQKASTPVLSTQVVSHDGRAVLVETGHVTPLRWFLDNRGSDSDDIDKRPLKRQKRSPDEAKNARIDDDLDDIVLGQVALDLNFAREAPTEANLAADLGDSELMAIPVMLKSVKQDDGILSLQMAHTTEKGALLNLDAAPIADDIFHSLSSCVRATTKEIRPASKYRCVIRKTANGMPRSITLLASVAWRDGVSAFPAGAPVGKAKVYSDYALFSHLYPDLARQTLSQAAPWMPQDFYDSVYTPDKNMKIELGEKIEAHLFPFQQRTVNWMLVRERVKKSDGHPRAPALYHSDRDAFGEALYYNPLEAKITRTGPDPDIKGGILAEEMGLGKTVEITALIAEHPSPVAGLSTHDARSNSEVTMSKATLIITPPTILKQWVSELSQHAPTLKVHLYTGMSSNEGRNDTETLRALCNDYDIVLTTYRTLGDEVHFATDPPDRNMRHQRKYERRKSLLIQIMWWRICLDEAQMVESGVTAAAQVACRIPRINSWAVSGTPVKKNVEDLFGLLLFLRLEPFASNSKIWSHLITNHRHLFRELFSSIALRHTKAQIRDEIQLPPQKRVVMTLPFTAVETQHYTTLFQEMCDEVGLQQDGSPKAGDWDPHDSRTVEAMRTWLIRLRQTCLHPQVGGRNRRRLGRAAGPLRTVAEVLDLMIEQNEVATRSEERAAIQSLLLRAHIVGNAKDDQERSMKSLKLYQDAQSRCEEDMVAVARSRLSTATSDDAAPRSDDEDSSSETAPLASRLRNALRGTLQLLHVCIYFAATATYQIKVNEEITPKDSQAFKDLEMEETTLYERAKVIRREILRDAANKAEKAMARVKKLQDAPAKLPSLMDLEKSGGIESRRIVQDSYEIFDVIHEIEPHIQEWRAKIIELLNKALVDEDDVGNEITGDEYEDSTKQQDELYVYFDAMKALQSDLNRCITGEAAPLIDHEARGLVKTAKRWLDPEVLAELKEQPHAPELCLKLFGIRQAIRAKLDKIGSVRSLIADARRLQDPTNVTGRAIAESEIARHLLNQLQSVMTSFTNALATLQKEVDLSRETQNLRLDFYRQLQELSDAVAPYKEELDETLDRNALRDAIRDEESASHTLASLRTKHKYLMHLKQESTHDESARICVICQCAFDQGTLTICGHQFCKECIKLWWSQHRTCPVCKRKLALVDFHDITYKPREVKVQEELNSAPESSSKEDTAVAGPSTSIYSAADEQLRDQIQSVDLPSSYGTKIDTLSRHLLWIRERDPGAKSIVFSQYREFLDVLSGAFSEFRIGHARLGKPNAVETFRQNAGIDCLLLDAKTDSSGLTLVNATHVFICEPLVQTAVELQAIARVHRIGQIRPTTVWMYLVNETVEESIYEISVQRRLAHVQARQSSRATTPAIGEQAIDAANSEELQNAPLSKLLVSGKAGGEVVNKDDLWQCLFGNAKPLTSDGGVTSELDRNLRAHAAEQRAAAG